MTSLPVDNFSRRAGVLRLSVTKRCDLNCIYCRPRGGDEGFSGGELTNSEMLCIVRTLAKMGLKTVRVTGGEPLIKDSIIEFLADLSGVPGIGEVLVTTNGQRLSKMARPLKTTGVRRVNVSLDTLREERYQKLTGGKNVTAVIDGIRAAVVEGLKPVRINMVPLAGINDDEICDFVDMAMEPRISVRFIERMPFGDRRTGAFVPTKIVKAIIENEFGKLKELGRMEGCGPAEYAGLKNGVVVGFISSMTSPACSQCKRIRLTADGILKTCIATAGGVDLKPAVRSGQNLTGIIQNTIASKWKARPADFGEAKKIPMSFIGG